MSEMKFTDENVPTLTQLKEQLRAVRYRRNFRRILGNTISSLIVVAAAAVLISMLFLPVLKVTGQSMTPTFQNNEMVICSKWSDFESGDVVAFYYNNQILLKRVIGTAGDIIDIKDDGTVYINGEYLDEPYISQKSLGECDLTFPYQVPESRIFVMGDHREVSIDSRSNSVGCIASEHIIGKVFFRIYPFREVGYID